MKNEYSEYASWSLAVGKLATLTRAILNTGEESSTAFHLEETRLIRLCAKVST